MSDAIASDSGASQEKLSKTDQLSEMTQSVVCDGTSAEIQFRQI